MTEAQGQHTGPQPLRASPHLESAFEVLGRKWNAVIIDVLAQRPARFGELRAAVAGISDRMLSGRLRELVDAGLVTHTRLPPGPTAYAVTADGKALALALGQVCAWSQRRTAVPACAESGTGH